MSATAQQTEAIRLIGDWSKWIATVETAAIAVIGALAKGSGKQSLPFLAVWLYSAAIVFFVVSITAAAMVLVSLPAAVQDINEHEKVWDRVCTLWGCFPAIRKVVAGQFLLFILGILTFGCGVVATVFNR